MRYTTWKNGVWKIAARAGLRHISKMIQQGNISGASALAKSPGVLKPSVAGSQIRHLGRGSEGLATLTASPQHGVAVRKLYDPKGISGQSMIARKEQAGKSLGDNPNFAKFLGSAQTPAGGQMHFSEFIPSGQAPVGQEGARSVRHTQVQAQKALTQAGFAGGKDIRKGNMVFDPRTNSHKVIDYIPANKGEFLRMPQRRENVVASTPGSASPWNPNYEVSAEEPQGPMLSRLIGGRPQVAQNIQRPVSAMASTNLARKTPPLATVPGHKPKGFAHPISTPPIKPAPVEANVTRPLKKPLAMAPTVPLNP